MKSLTTGLPLVVFRMEWKGQWQCVFACPGYEVLTGLSSPVGKTVLDLPFSAEDRLIVERTLSDLRERREPRPLQSQWGYQGKAGKILCNCVLHPSAFDETGRCCEALGYFYPCDDVGISLRHEILGRWLAAQPRGTQDFLLNYAKPELNGVMLTLRFECDSYSKLFDELRKRGEIIDHPPGVPDLRVMVCCPECMAA
jgi:hypothetical protein